MIDFYAAMIIKGNRTFDVCPAPIKPQVKECLVSLGVGHLAE
jgi:hypothetical protein